MSIAQVKKNGTASGPIRRMMFMARWVLAFAAVEPLIVAHRGDSLHAPETPSRPLASAGRPARYMGAGRPVNPRRRPGRPARRVAPADDRRRPPFHGRPPRPRRLPGLRLRLRRGPDSRRRLLVCRRSAATIGPRLRDARRLDPAASSHSLRVGAIPTLEEALGFTREHDWLVNVEIKSFPTSAGAGRAGARRHRGNRDGGSGVDLLV